MNQIFGKIKFKHRYKHVGWKVDKICIAWLIDSYNIVHNDPIFIKNLLYTIYEFFPIIV